MTDTWTYQVQTSIHPRIVHCVEKVCQRSHEVFVLVVPVTSVIVHVVVHALTTLQCLVRRSYVLLLSFRLLLKDLLFLRGQGAECARDLLDDVWFTTGACVPHRCLQERTVLHAPFKL